MDAKTGEAVESAVVKAIEQVEQRLDNEIERLNNPTDDDLEAIRRRRLAEMRKDAENRALWRRNGHGKLQRIAERDFFARAKGTARMVAVFCRTGTSRYSDDLVEHMERVAEAHLETLFVVLDAEKAPFLCTRLNIRVMPSLLMVRDGEIDKLLPGLDEISVSGKFSTVRLEKRLFDFDMLTDTNIADDD